MYGCDCDGVTREPLDRGVEGDAIRSHLVTIERVAGHRPPTCPWRAMSEPAVLEVLSVAWAVDGGNLAAVLGADPDAHLVQALGIYRRALTRTANDERRIQHEEAEAKRKAAQHAARSRRG